MLLASGQDDSDAIQLPKTSIGINFDLSQTYQIIIISRASPAACSEESGESSIPESRARARPWRAPQPQHKMAADRLRQIHYVEHVSGALRARVQ